MSKNDWQIVAIQAAVLVVLGLLLMIFWTFGGAMLLALIPGTLLSFWLGVNAGRRELR